MGMILRIASSRIVGQGDIVGRSGYFSLNLSANSVMRGRLDARRTLKSLVADLRVNSLLMKKEAIRCNGKIYSEEHRRKFDIKNDIFKVEKNPTDNNKLVLTINRQPIGEWFREQWGKLKQGLYNSVQTEKRGRGFRM